MRHILIFAGGDSSMGKLAERLRVLDVEPLAVDRVEEAIPIVAECSGSVSAALLSTAYPLRELKGELRALAQAGPASGVTCIAVGAPADKGTRKRLRAAGVALALWEPFDDGTLRFQINRAIHGDLDPHHRRNPRVPTYLLSQISVGGRTKDAVVYSLSQSGAFLETPRASIDGAEIDVEIRLPGQLLRSRAEVAFANVPGNLQRPNLPLGIGVRFVDLSANDEKHLGKFIAERRQQLAV